MLKIVHHIGATRGSQEKHLKFPIDVDPRGPYKHHLVVRVDTGADVNCMNEKTFKKLFPKMKLSVPMRYRTLETQSQTFLYWDSFTLTCSSGEKSTCTLLLSPMPMTAPIYSAMEQPSEWVYYYQTNYPEENVVKGENVPNFKFNRSTSTSTGTSSNVFQILQDL